MAKFSFGMRQYIECLSLQLLSGKGVFQNLKFKVGQMQTKGYYFLKWFYKVVKTMPIKSYLMQNFNVW